MHDIKNVTLICGGRSLEHNISLMSAKNIYASLKNLYQVNIIRIEKNGLWVKSSPETAFDPSSTYVLEKQQIHLAPGEKNPLKVGANFTALECDIIFPVLHGNLGEDGTVPALCEILDLPYVGCNQQACGIAMHKPRCNTLMQAAGIPCLANLTLKIGEKYNSHDICAKLSLPIIIKPVHLGSSIGIQIVKQESELDAAIAASFKVDNEIMLETLFANSRDIECAILSDGDNIICAEPGEIVKNDCLIYDYDAKYNNPNAATPVVAADLPAACKEKLKQFAITAFKVIGGSGLARVDFLYRDGEIYLNEINPLPGYTNISLHPKCLQASGYSMEQIMQHLITSGMKQYQQLPHNIENNN